MQDLALHLLNCANKVSGALLAAVRSMLIPFYGRDGGKHFFCNVPFALERNRKRSVADIMFGRHGDAAFADYALLLAYSRHF